MIENPEELARSARLMRAFHEDQVGVAAAHHPDDEGEIDDHTRSVLDAEGVRFVADETVERGGLELQPDEGERDG